MITQQQQAFLDITGLDYKDNGSEIITPCPFCGEQRYKFYFNSEGLFHCWLCETSGGSIYSFVSQYLNCSYKDARKYLNSYNFEFSNNIKIVKSLKNNNLFGVLLDVISPTISTPLTMPRLPTNTKSIIDNFDNPDAYPYLAYLKKRNVSYEQLFKYDIRYCTNGTCLLPSGSNLTVRNSIIFITHNIKGEPVYWNTRSIDKDPFIKSFNAAGVETEYNRKNVIFNESKLVNGKPVVWCEGVFNAITVDDDLKTGIATFGKNVTDEQINRVTSLTPDSKHYVFLDTDARTQAIYLCKRLVESRAASDNIYIVNNPYYSLDANDLGTEKSNELIRSSTKFDDREMISSIMKSKL